MRIALLGSGELGADHVTAFARLGAEVIAVDSVPGGPAARVAHAAETVTLTDPVALTAALRRLAPEVIVTATDRVAANALAAFEGEATVVPSARNVRMALDREGLRRLAADRLGLPTAPFWFASSAAELAAIAAHAGFPMVVKPLVTLPSDGQSVLLRAEDVEPAWRRAVSVAGRISHPRVLAETVVEIDHELTLLTLGSADGLVFCEPIGHCQVEGFAGQTVLESWQPQRMSRVALETAHSIAARIVNALGGRGLFGVELLVAGDEVYFSDVNAWPTDAGLVTLRSQRLSVFDLHARAVLGLPLDTIMISPAAAELTYGDGAVPGPGPAELATALRVPESDVRVFGGPSRVPRRRLGLALATAADVTTARDRVRRATTALHTSWRTHPGGRQ
ncbi:formate-dependent phosphoribosylglycinamide formyltransferase [Mycolicibacterium fallax]|uniref:Phosphoribosylglycinamide formyltransferase n=1 Tax=Mycolicibacterium fallax TaxID=1793 RepID=A0A1X1RCS3_MYCFA|nr:formate-dependent phosphoribosylglycinamide formyltransferase [Mycolicibacterium fallax]ORV03134.1 phosphoribosylglycinamide formyltransferase [Mycolicibacterium fallax]BBY98865.1 phosphoribosylglycinamide formyltransferase 2 [Mycolicibacterium fallax]HOW93582.1 formate-dependent phosphoribosylglycinamide formyltransferase [Mycolicibacterium fallax]